MMYLLSLGLLVFVVLTQPSLSQRIVDPVYTIEHFNDSSYTRTIDSNGTIFSRTVTINVNWADTTLFSANQSNFIFGYQWGGGTNYAVEDRLYSNALQGYFEESNPYVYGIKSIMPYHRRIYSTYRPHWDDRIFTPALEWYPGAPIRTGTSLFVPIAGERIGAINGFAFKNGGGIVNDSSDVNFLKYVLLPDSVHTPFGDTSRLVLKSPVLFVDHPKHEFEMRLNDIVAADNDSDADRLKAASINGTRWYLAVNIRRYNSDTVALDTQRVLRFSIKRWSKHDNSGVFEKDSSYIRFDSVSVFTASGDTVHDSRGVLFRSLKSATADSTELIVRRNMIPLYSQPDSLKDITVYAYFRTSSVSAASHFRSSNILFHRADPENTGGEIDSIDLICEYSGNCPVVLGRISLLTPSARRLFLGQFDTLIARTAYSCIDDVKVRQNNDTLAAQFLRFFRWYGLDEPKESIWRAHRYLSKFLAGRMVTEGVGSDVYRHLTETSELWTGGGPASNYVHQSPMMYHKLYDPGISKHKADSLNRRIGLGYSQGWSSPGNQLTYECKECPKTGFGIDPFVPPFVENGNYLTWGTNFNMCAIEEFANNSYMNRNYLYRSSKWWFNSWLAGSYVWNLIPGATSLWS